VKRLQKASAASSLWSVDVRVLVLPSHLGGHSVDVLRIYAKCVVGQDELAKRRIGEALRQD
jgi:hypothetical protein